MHFYSIHVIAEYNLLGSKIICRQIFEIIRAPPLGCVRKTFSGPTLVWLGLSFVLGQYASKKILTLLVNIFLYRNATEVPTPRAAI